MKKPNGPAIAAALFLLTAAVYARAAFFPFFVLDDGDYVTNNVHVASGLSLDSIRWALTAFHAGNWHPVTWLSLMTDSQLFGTEPSGFHVVNLLLHALNAALLFLLCNRMTGAVGRSAFVAACFALHPLRVESVAWIAERKDVLSTLFLILTLLFYVAYVRKGKLRSFLLSLAAFTLGLMAKPMLVSTPVLLLLLDYWPLERPAIRPFAAQGRDPVIPPSGLKRLLLEKVPFVLLAAASSAVTLLAQRASISGLTNVPLLDRCTNALWSLILYIEKMFLPINLAVLYPLAPVPLWKGVVAAVLLGGTSFVVVRYARNRKYLAVGWFWYLISLLPVIGLVQVGRQAMADRYSYIPFIGLFIMVAWGGEELFRRLSIPRKAVAYGATAVVVLLTLVTWRQLGYWRSNEDIVAHTLDVTENNYFGHYTLGLVYDQEKKPDLAMAEYRKSIAIEPRDPMVHFDLGILLDSRGNGAEAVRQFEDAIALDPGFAQAHFALGIALGKLGAVNESIGKFNDALGLDPENPKFLNNLGVALARQGRVDEAIELFERALRTHPDDMKAMENLQIARQQKLKATAGQTESPVVRSPREGSP